MDLKGLAKPGEPTVTVRGGSWKRLDFAKARMASLRLFDVMIEDCCFDGADLSELRMWGTRILRTSFRGADLRGAALGGVENGKRNLFQDVDFTKADLRRTSHQSSDMVRCLFSNTKLKQAEFRGTVFVDCTFEGKLEEVIFYRVPTDAKHLPPNEMKDVDLSRAKLRWAAFRGLDMDRVQWPEDGEHLLIRDYARTLTRVIDTFKGRTDLGSKGFTAVFSDMKKWVGPKQTVGIISKADVLDIAGEAGLRELIGLLPA